MLLFVLGTLGRVDRLRKEVIAADRCTGKATPPPHVCDTVAALEVRVPVPSVLIAMQRYCPSSAASTPEICRVAVSTPETPAPFVNSLTPSAFHQIQCLAVARVSHPPAWCVFV